MQYIGNVCICSVGHSVLVDGRGEEKDKLHDDIWSLNLITQKVSNSNGVIVFKSHDHALTMCTLGA